MNISDTMLGRSIASVRWPLIRTIFEHPDTRATPTPPPADDPIAWPEQRQWMPDVRPDCDGDNETLGDCAVENGTMPVQAAYHAKTGIFRNLRHVDIYRAMNLALNGNANTDNGFTLMESAQYQKTIGIIKPDCAIEEIELTQDALVVALTRGPLIAGVSCVGMMPQDLSAFGFVDESQAQGAEWMLTAGGHCIGLPGILNWNDRNVCIFKNGGWGAIGLSGEGLIMGTLWWYLRVAMCKPVLITHASGDIVGTDYEKWAV